MLFGIIDKICIVCVFSIYVYRGKSKRGFFYLLKNLPKITSFEKNLFLILGLARGIFKYTSFYSATNVTLSVKLCIEEWHLH
jgi:hypothetical protein